MCCPFPLHTGDGLRGLDCLLGLEEKKKKELNSLVENTSALVEGSGVLLCFVLHVDSVCRFACNLNSEIES